MRDIPAMSGNNYCSSFLLLLRAIYTVKKVLDFLWILLDENLMINLRLCEDQGKRSDSNSHQDNRES